MTVMILSLFSLIAVFTLVSSEAQFQQYPAYSKDIHALYEADHALYDGSLAPNKTPARPTPPRPRRQSRGGNPTPPRDLVSEIHCLKTENRETFSSLLRLPSTHSAPPVIEGVMGVASDGCDISKTSLDQVFALEVRDLSGCGVRECLGEAEGESWLCLMVRFPAIGGLKLPEDEVIDIKCRPQDRSMTENSVINFQENSVEQRSPAIFTGGSQEVLTEIGLFRRMAGTELYNARVKSGSVIELGEKVQLRSIVRSGDGWSYAKLTDVVVHRIHNGEPQEEHKMQMVSEDGCRNPHIKPLAKFNPWRDVSNSLINNFDFRVFMFQEMLSGDSIIITAQVIACVEEVDCEPVNCDGDDLGYGRKRRSVGPKGKTKGWESNVELKVSLPSDDDSVTSDVSSSREDECKLYLVLTLATALTFLVLSGVIVLVACVRRWQEMRGGKAGQEDNNSRLDTASVKSNSSAGFKSRAGEGNSTAALKGSCTGHGAIPAYYFVPYNPREAFPQSPSTAKPVTVRHVKRRDRVKTEEKNRINSFSEKRGATLAQEESPEKKIDIWRKGNQSHEPETVNRGNKVEAVRVSQASSRTKEDERAVMV